MREFSVTFQKGLKKGLRKHFKNPRNEEWLFECHNLMPTESGLQPHETVTLIGAEVHGYLVDEAGDKILHDGVSGIRL